MMADNEAGWVRVASVADVPEGQMHAVRIGDADIALYHLEGGEFRATDNVCTHEYACLTDGWLEDGVIECPLHGGRFDVRSGEGLCPPIEQKLKTYPVQQSGDDLLIQLGG
jgi:nitrite reductase/ring-hydroxylating ferredoxin subunit